MNLKEIKEIVNLMNDNNLGEVEVEREGIKLKIKKDGAGAPVVQQAMPLQAVPSPAAQQEAASEPASAQKEVKTGRKEIQSPMVGTFYSSPSPDASPFVEVGSTVEVGQVVCIVEAMKLMNEIKSEVKGKIVEVAVDNAEPVEFGQALFYVEPA